MSLRTRLARLEHRHVRRVPPCQRCQGRNVLEAVHYEGTPKPEPCCPGCGRTMKTILMPVPADFAGDPRSLFP